MRLACAEINLSALKNNLTQVKKIAQNVKVMAVLKANAYGHGLVKIAQNLSQADAFAVARIDEALALRAGGLVKPIVLLEGVFRDDDLAIAAANNFKRRSQAASLPNATKYPVLVRILLSWMPKISYQLPFRTFPGDRAVPAVGTSGPPQEGSRKILGPCVKLLSSPFP